MSEDNKVLALHVAGVIAILACLILSVTVFKGVPLAAEMAMAAAAGLYGKFGFMPLKTIVVRRLASLPDEEVKRLTSRPPGKAAPTASPAAPIEPPPPLGKIR